jgi:hypothetical protein
MGRQQQDIELALAGRRQVFGRGWGQAQDFRNDLAPWYSITIRLEMNILPRQ